MNYTLNDLRHGAAAMARSVFGKKKEYELKFNHEEDGLWYVDFPNWPFDHHNLLMVSGSDELCEFLSDDDKTTKVKVIPAKKEEEHEGYFKLTQKEHGLTSGSTYAVSGLEGWTRDIWVCPVTLFVLGEYPKYIYIKKCSSEE